MSTAKQKTSSVWSYYSEECGTPLILHCTTSFQPKSSEEKMVIGKVGHLIHYGAFLIPIRWGTKLLVRL